jgi:ABC-type antimicrobial peptide transport system permease subunit
MSEQQVQALLVRALKTFVQGFLGFLITGVTLGNLPAGTSALWGLLTGAIAAGVSALMNAYLKPLEAK